MFDLTKISVKIPNLAEFNADSNPAYQILDLFRCLMSDFQSQNRTSYKAAHVYFTEALPEERFKGK